MRLYEFAKDRAKQALHIFGFPVIPELADRNDKNQPIVAGFTYDDLLDIALYIDITGATKEEMLQALGESQAIKDFKLNAAIKKKEALLMEAAELEEEIQELKEPK